MILTLILTMADVITSDLEARIENNNIFECVREEKELEPLNYWIDEDKHWWAA